MIEIGFIHALDMYIVEFSHVVLAKLPLLYVLLDGVLADNAGAFPVV